MTGRARFDKINSQNTQRYQYATRVVVNNNIIWLIEEWKTVPIENKWSFV